MGLSRTDFSGILFLGLLVSGFLHGAEVQPTPVIVAPVRSVELTDRLEALGTTRANESVIITANVTEKVVEIHFDDGDTVEKGDVLVVLEKSEEEARLSEVLAVLSERQLALKRLQRLEQQQLAATENLDQRRLAVQQAEAEEASIRARIADLTIRAPFAGVLGLRNISVGTLVAPGDPITTLDDIRVVKLDFTVPAIYLPELRVGLSIQARATALGGRVFEGTIKSIDSRVDPVTRAVNVRALLPNPSGEIKPGLLMRIELHKNRRQAMVLPETAILAKGSSHAVMVVDEDSHLVARREVVIGTRRPGTVEIVSGLQIGELAITHGNDRVQPGAVVSITAREDDTSSTGQLIRDRSAR